MTADAFQVGLGLVLKAVVLWNTRYLDATVAQLRGGNRHRGRGRGPLLSAHDRHINFLGHYLFNIKASGLGQGLRPFRDPDAVEEAED